MRVFTHTVWIARSPEQVFEFLCDFSQASRWRSMVRSVTTVDGGPLRADSRLRVAFDVLGEQQESEITMLALERPSLWKHRTGESDVTGIVEYRLVPERGGTRVTMSGTATPATIYGWLALPLMWMRRGKQYVEQLPQLKRALEG